MITLYDVDTDDDGALVATSVLPGDRDIAVLFDAEDTPRSVAEMEAAVVEALSALTADELTRIEADLATELSRIMLGAAGQARAADGSSAADTSRHLDDLRVTGAVVLADRTTVLMFEAPGEYPDAAVYCQLDAELRIVDVSVEVDAAGSQPQL